MSLESATYLSALNASNPLAGDSRSEGDDHLRLIKSALKNTFPNANAAINPTVAEFNYLVGVTSSIQTQLDTKAPMPATTATLFYQASAPTGWTKSTINNDKALRVVSGSGGVAGNGSGPAFSVAFASKSVAGTISGTALTTAQLPAHSHTMMFASLGGNVGGSSGSATALYTGASSVSTGSAGSDATHTHTFTGTAINLAVQYCDVIIATRN